MDSFEEIRRAMNSHNAWLDALKPSIAIQHQLEEMHKLIGPSLSQLGLDRTSQLMLEAERVQERWREMTRPLEKLRESMRGSELMYKAMEDIARQNSWRDQIEKISQSHSEMFASAASSLRLTDEVTKRLAQDLAVTRLDRLAELAKPFQGLKDVLDSNSAFSEAMKAISAQTDLFRDLRLPVIDSSAAQAVARLWGAEGIEKQLRAFGIDYKRLLQESEVEAPAESESVSATEGLKGSGIDFWTVVSILLAIWIFLYELHHAEQMESRIKDEIHSSSADTRKRLEVVEQLLNSAIEMRQPSEEGRIQFVVRSRMAVIRRKPEPGSMVLAEVFPNQVVTLLDEHGKWIEVEYFDWVAQETSRGWALKKYFTRVKQSKN